MTDAKSKTQKATSVEIIFPGLCSGSWLPGFQIPGSTLLDSKPAYAPPICSGTVGDFQLIEFQFLIVLCFFLASSISCSLFQVWSKDSKGQPQPLFLLRELDSDQRGDRGEIQIGNIMKQMLYCLRVQCYIFINGDVNGTIKCDPHQLPVPIATYLYLPPVILPFILQIFIRQPPCATHTHCFPPLYRHLFCCFRLPPRLWRCNL